MATSRIVAIVDDDDAVRRSTAQLIERAGYRVQTFASGDEFLERPPGHLDCVLLDMRMPGRNGLDVLKILDRSDDAPAVIVFTGHGDIALAVEAMKLGAADFLEKPYKQAALLAGIDHACALRVRPRASQAAGREAAARLESLSERQRQVLRGIVKGKSNKVIAHELGLSIRTIEGHRSRLLIQLGVRSIGEVVQIALAGGLDAESIQA